MNKRITKKRLTAEKLLVLKLYKECDKVNFSKYDVSNEMQAIEFVRILGEPEYAELGGSNWFRSKKGNIRAVAFLDEEA